jgi:hypothetical protein
MESHHPVQRITSPHMRALISRFENRRIRYAVRMGLLSFVMGGVAAFLFIWDQPGVKVAGDVTIWHFVLLTFYISFVTSLIGYRLLAFEQEKITRLERLAQGRSHRKDWLQRFIVSFAVAWILAAGCQAVFLILISRWLGSAELPRLVMMLLFAVYAAILGAGVAFFIVGVDSVELFFVFAGLTIGAVLFSATLVSNREWWQRSVSALGIDPGSGLFFNITIILVGLVAMTYARDLLDDLKLLTEMRLFPSSGYNFTRLGLTGMALGIVGIGLFPTEGLVFSHFLHQLTAYVVVGISFTGMFFLGKIVPNVYPKGFVYFSTVLGVICLLVVLVYTPIQLEFAWMELILFSLLGVWIGCLGHETKQYVRRQPVAGREG